MSFIARGSAPENPAPLQLRRWSEDCRDDFAEMHSDPEVMADLGGPFDRAASDEKFGRYRNAWTIDGVSRWAVFDWAGGFLATPV